MENPIAQYLRPDVIRRIARLDVQARCIAEGFLNGLHRSPYRGFSTEFSEHRKYVPGDDLKHLDWNVFGRTDRMYLKTFEARTNLECTLLVDVSASMAYRHDDSEVSKLEYAIYLAAAISYLLIRQHDAVGLLTFDARPQMFLRPNSKRQQLSAVISALAQAQTQGRTRFSSSLAPLPGLLRHRGLVVVFSDFIGDMDGVAEGLRGLRFKGHDVVAFRILDAAETTLPFSRSCEFVNSEDPEDRVRAEPDEIRQVYRAEMDDFGERLETLCQQHRVQYLALTTEQPFDVALQRFFAERRASG